MKTPDDSTGGSTELLVSAIVPDPKNRKEHDGEQLRSLADSIKTDGLLQPIVVRQIAPGKFMLVAGERRWRAHGLLRLAKIPAIITSTGAQAPTAADVRKRAAENFQREDLTPIEEAQLFRELHIEHKIPQAEIAKLRGRGNQSTVANALRLLELPAEVQKLVQDGELTRAHGIALARWAKWPKICRSIAGWAVKKGLSSKDLEDRDLPVSYELIKEGLVVEIETHTWGSGVVYKLPEAFRKDPDFIKQGYGDDWYCLNPAKWAPEKARQDKEREAAEAAKKKADVAAVAKGGKTKEQLERAKKLASNKAARAKIADHVASMRLRLAAVKTIDAASVAFVCNNTAGHVGTEIITDTAASLGIKLPKGFQGWQRQWWLKLKPVDALRLAAAAHATSDGQHAMRFAGKVPEEVTFMLGKGGAK